MPRAAVQELPCLGVSADLVLHYSFPAGTLAGDALREFVLFVLAQGVDARRRLVG